MQASVLQRHASYRSSVVLNPQAVCFTFNASCTSDSSTHGSLFPRRRMHVCLGRVVGPQRSSVHHLHLHRHLPRPSSFRPFSLALRPAAQTIVTTLVPRYPKAVFFSLKVFSALYLPYSLCCHVSCFLFNLNVFGLI